MQRILRFIVMRCVLGKAVCRWILRFINLSLSFPKTLLILGKEVDIFLESPDLLPQNILEPSSPRPLLLLPSNVDHAAQLMVITSPLADLDWSYLVLLGQYRSKHTWLERYCPCGHVQVRNIKQKKSYVLHDHHDLKTDVISLLSGKCLQKRKGKKKRG